MSTTSSVSWFTEDGVCNACRSLPGARLHRLRIRADRGRAGGGRGRCGRALRLRATRRAPGPVPRAPRRSRAPLGPRHPVPLRDRFDGQRHRHGRGRHGRGSLRVSRLLRCSRPGTTRRRAGGRRVVGATRPERSLGMQPDPLPERAGHRGRRRGHLHPSWCALRRGVGVHEPHARHRPLRVLRSPSLRRTARWSVHIE